MSETPVFTGDFGFSCPYELRNSGSRTRLGVSLSDGHELARFCGLAAKHRAVCYLAKLARQVA